MVKPLKLHLITYLSNILVLFVKFVFTNNYACAISENNDNGTIGVHHEDWMRLEIMDNNGLYRLEWWTKSKEIFFKATVNTQGFIGLGFSRKSAKMAESDIVLAWVDDRNGKAHVLDCHGPNFGNTAPLRDDTQNYNVIEGHQNATYTQIIFSRTLETCDPYDLPITEDTVKVLWAFGQNDPTQDGTSVIAKHGANRGIKSLHLLRPFFKKPAIHNNIRKWDVTVSNVTVESSMDTLYWCKIIKAPTLQEKHHIIGYEALLTKEITTDKPLVHHMTLFECSTMSYPGSDSSSWDVWVKSTGAICNSNLLTPRDWDSCITPVAVWAIGSTGQFLPEHVGIPIGGRTSPKYYMLEIHYDNPTTKTIYDHSGFRIHYTKYLRQYDSGMMIVGVSISDTQFIPPGQKSYRNIGICAPTCTNKLFPDNGIKIISSTLHSHMAGRRMKLRHIRDGKELLPIIEDNNYDYNFQQVQQLENETIVLPGDYIILDCIYETSNRKKPTFGGYSTKQEICLSFITYYPKIDLAGCYSMTPVREFFETFGVYQFYSLNMTDVENLFLYKNSLDITPTTILTKTLHANTSNSNRYKEKSSEKSGNQFLTADSEDVLIQESLLNKLIISDPVEFHGKTFLSHINQLPWSEPLFTKRVEQAIIVGKHMTFCRVSNESVSIASEIVRFPNFKVFTKPQIQCPYNLLMSHQTNLSITPKINNVLTFLILISHFLIK